MKLMVKFMANFVGKKFQLELCIKDVEVLERFQKENVMRFKKTAEVSNISQTKMERKKEVSNVGKSRKSDEKRARGSER